MQKNLNLKNSYKRLEEEYNKAQKRIQSLPNGTIEEPTDSADKIAKTNALFSCDQCTKNFLSADSLKSHRQRKHSVVEEKHESSDDNEKGKANDSNARTKNTVQCQSDAAKQSDRPVDVMTEFSKANAGDDTEQNIPNAAVLSEKDASNDKDSGSVGESNSPEEGKSNEGNNQNNDEKSNDPIESTTSDMLANNNEAPSNKCAACLQRGLPSSANIGVQCDDFAARTNNNGMSGLESDLIQTAYETISELKNDILELRSALAGQATNSELQGIKMPTAEGKLYDTNEKIDVIEQKFNAFENKFMQSQHEFIESFRSLDEQQRSYMTNMQATIKEIVEKSLTEQHSTVDTAASQRLDTERSHPRRNDPLQPAPNQAQSMDTTQGNVETKSAQSKPEAKPRTVLQKQPVSSSSESDSDNGEVVCRVDIHAADSDCSDDKGKGGADISKRTDPRKDVISELEQRLRQIGVDADSTGLSTPRSEQAQHNLSDDREEMVKVGPNSLPTVKCEVLRVFSAPRIFSVPTFPISLFNSLELLMILHLLSF